MDMFEFMVEVRGEPAEVEAVRQHIYDLALNDVWWVVDEDERAACVQKASGDAPSLQAAFSPHFVAGINDAVIKTVITRLAASRSERAAVARCSIWRSGRPLLESEASATCLEVLREATFAVDARQRTAPVIQRSLAPRPGSKELMTEPASTHSLKSAQGSLQVSAALVLEDAGHENPPTRTVASLLVSRNQSRRAARRGFAASFAKPPVGP